MQYTIPWNIKSIDSVAVETNTHYEKYCALIFQEGIQNALHEIGTAGVVIQVTGTNWPRPSYTLLVTGICRFKLVSIIQEHPYPVAAVTQLDDIKDISDESKLLYIFFFQLVNKLVAVIDFFCSTVFV